MSRLDRIVIAAVGGALVLALAAGWVLLAPGVGDGTPASGELVLSVPSEPSDPTEPAPGSAPPSTSIVVDVQGAVAAPGVRELPADARVADAIGAAGGYAPDADLEAASATINLAQPLVDGGQIRVPRIGEAVSAGPSAPAAGGGGGAAAGGAVDINTATPEELDALPGIGPVTVQKLLAARQERPFASLEDAVQRGILDRGQLEDIQGLATAG